VLPADGTACVRGSDCSKRAVRIRNGAVPIPHSRFPIPDAAVCDHPTTYRPGKVAIAARLA